MRKTQRNRFKKQERLKKWKLRKRGKQKLLQKFLKQQREFPINKVGLVFSTMIISKKSTASFTHSSPPKQAPVHVNEAQKKPKTITSNTGAASPTSSILILGEPVLNSGKTSSQDHAKKKANNKGTSCSFCVASLKIQIWAFPHGKKWPNNTTDKKAIENVGVLPSNVAFIPFWECCLFWSLTIILRSAKIFLKLYLLVVLWRTKLKAPSQSLCLKRQINLVVFPQTPSLWEEPPWKGTLVPILYEEMLA